MKMGQKKNMRAVVAGAVMAGMRWLFLHDPKPSRLRAEQRAGIGARIRWLLALRLWTVADDRGQN